MMSCVVYWMSHLLYGISDVIYEMSILYKMDILCVVFGCLVQEVGYSDIYGLLYGISCVSLWVSCVLNGMSDMAYEISCLIPQMRCLVCHVGYLICYIGYPMCIVGYLV